MRVAGLAARRAAPPTPRHPRARGSSAGGTATRRSIPRTHLGIWRDAGAGAPRLLDTRTAAAATKDDDGPAEPGNGRSDRRAAGLTDGAICVQRLDDSLNSAIHTRYRSSRRSSSMHEPRGPPLEVVFVFQCVGATAPVSRIRTHSLANRAFFQGKGRWEGPPRSRRGSPL